MNFSTGKPSACLANPLVPVSNSIKAGIFPSLSGMKSSGKKGPQYLYHQVICNRAALYFHKTDHYPFNGKNPFAGCQNIGGQYRISYWEFSPVSGLKKNLACNFLAYRFSKEIIRSKFYRVVSCAIPKMAPCHPAGIPLTYQCRTVLCRSIRATVPTQIALQVYR